MNHSRLTTSKLFYNKWPYKILCRVSGSWKIKRIGVYETVRYCLSDEQEHPWVKRPVNKMRLLAFTNAVEKYLKKDVQIRTEGESFCIYCKDPALFESIVVDLDQYISKLWTPANDAEHEVMVESNAKKVFCNHLPHEKYTFKIHLRQNTLENTKSSFYKWMKNYGDKMRVTRATALWIETGRWTSPYVYVEDRPTLSMALLFLGNSVLKVEEFIPRSSINISLDQEQTCPL